MGRLWQTLILRHWKPLLAYLPVETVIQSRQDDYYRVLAEADKRAEATPFVEFMLEALLDAAEESVSTDQVSDQVSDQVACLLRPLIIGELSSSDLMTALDLSTCRLREDMINSEADKLPPFVSMAIFAVQIRPFSNGPSSGRGDWHSGLLALFSASETIQPAQCSI